MTRRRRRRNPISTGTLFKVGLVAVALYLLYTFVTKKLPQIAAPIAAPFANFAVWVQQAVWSVTGANITVNGNVQLPDGSYVPLSGGQVLVSTGPDGNTYAKIAGHVYQLQPSDINGDWPATLIQ